jgi:signal peptidase II
MADQPAPSTKLPPSGRIASESAPSADNRAQTVAATIAAAKPPRAVRIRAYRLLLTLATTVFALDQLTKWWIVMNVPFNPMHVHGGGSDIEVIPGFFYIIHVGNTGAAWSIFSGQSLLLALLAVATLFGIYFWRHSLGLRDRIVQISFGLLCGGIVGNLLDRLLHSHVIDFVDLHFGSYIYPTFNVADSGICVGVGLYLLYSLRNPENKPAEKAA